ncbi:MAG: hypothetical protein ABI777_09095 [Betaproteobacteria bacterium]
MTRFPMHARSLWPVAAIITIIIAAGCTPPPAIRIPEPEPEPGVPRRFTEEAERQAVAKHRKLAQEANRIGDYATAVTQWQILTLLAPNDPANKSALASARASVTNGVRDQLAAANAALAANDHERAAQAALRAMALDPENTDAARILREIDRRRMARLQADRAAKARIDDAMAIRNALQNQANASESSQPFEIDQAMELFRAGDTAAGLRELRAYVDAHPGNSSARQRAGRVVADRARELEDKGARVEALYLYDQATALYGDKAPWLMRAAALRKTVGAAAAKAKP